MAIQQSVNYCRSNDVSTLCHKCKGKCYVKHDNAQTQANAHSLLGTTIPADCIDMQDGSVNCPAELGYM